MGIVYKARSPSGKVYIGKSINDLASRKRYHTHSARYPERTGGDTKFKAALRKYGSKIQWTILHRSKSKNRLSALETVEIQRHDSFINGYNSTLGGDGGHGVEWTATRKTAFKARMTGINNPFFGKQHTHAARLEFSKKRKGRRRSSISALKQAATISGTGNPMFGKHHTEFAKQSMGAARTKLYRITTPQGCKIILRGLNDVIAFAQQYIGCGRHFYNRRKMNGFTLCRLP